MLTNILEGLRLQGILFWLLSLLEAHKAIDFQNYSLLSSLEMTEEHWLNC